MFYSPSDPVDETCTECFECAWKEMIISLNLGAIPQTEIIRASGSLKRIKIIAGLPPDCRWQFDPRHANRGSFARSDGDRALRWTPQHSMPRHFTFVSKRFYLAE
jgi:hypothetical protein